MRVYVPTIRKENENLIMEDMPSKKLSTDEPTYTIYAEQLVGFLLNKLIQIIQDKHYAPIPQVSVPVIAQQFILDEHKDNNIQRYTLRDPKSKEEIAKITVEGNNIDNNKKVTITAQKDMIDFILILLKKELETRQEIASKKPFRDLVYVELKNNCLEIEESILKKSQPEGLYPIFIEKLLHEAREKENDYTTYFGLTPKTLKELDDNKDVFFVRQWSITQNVDEAIALIQKNTKLITIRGVNLNLNASPSLSVNESESPSPENQERSRKRGATTSSPNMSLKDEEKDSDTEPVLKRVRSSASSESSTPSSPNSGSPYVNTGQPRKRPADTSSPNMLFNQNRNTVPSDETEPVLKKVKSETSSEPSTPSPLSNNGRKEKP